MSCPDCFVGTEHVGQPRGTVETIHNLPTYVARPDNDTTPKGVIVYIPDAFGWSFVNNRILADHYATRTSALVYLPDFMGGSSCPLSVLTNTEALMAPGGWLNAIFWKPVLVAKIAVSVAPWLWKTRESVAKPRLISFFQQLRTSAPPFPTDDLKVGAAGFCWGGLYTVFLAADPPSTRVARHDSQKTTGIQPLIDCGFTAHPSRLKVPADIEAVNIPLSVAIGNEDLAMKGPLIQQMKEILEVKKKGDHEVVIMPGAKHGFAVRTNPNDTLQMDCAEKAEAQAVSWFTRWFA